jgi:putative ABC transport system ATP-binding protein
MILADEPTASVDPLNADRIFALFVELVGESGAALVVSSHDTDRVTRPDFIHLHHELTESDTRIVSTLKVAR